MDQYKYTYERTAERTANYCYKDMEGLINNLNITNDKDLYEEKENL